MNQKTSEVFTEQDLPAAVQKSLQAGLDKKAEKVVVLKLSELSSFTDYFVIMQGNSSKQNTALKNHIEQELKKMRIKPLSVEGDRLSEWILMDYGSFIVHIFSPDMRQYYALEKLWGDAPKLAY